MAVLFSWTNPTLVGFYFFHSTYSSAKIAPARSCVYFTFLRCRVHCARFYLLEAHRAEHYFASVFWLLFAMLAWILHNAFEVVWSSVEKFNYARHANEEKERKTTRYFRSTDLLSRLMRRKRLEQAILFYWSIFLNKQSIIFNPLCNSLQLFFGCKNSSLLFLLTLIDL